MRPGLVRLRPRVMMHCLLVAIKRELPFAQKCPHLWDAAAQRLLSRAEAEVTAAGAILEILTAFGYERPTQVIDRLMPAEEFLVILKAILPDSQVKTEALQFFRSNSSSQK